METIGDIFNNPIFQLLASFLLLFSKHFFYAWKISLKKLLEWSNSTSLGGGTDIDDQFIADLIKVADSIDEDGLVEKLRDDKGISDDASKELSEEMWKRFQHTASIDRMKQYEDNYKDIKETYKVLSKHAVYLWQIWKGKKKSPGHVPSTNPK